MSATGPFRRPHARRRGLTLVELLVTMAVLAVVLSLAIGMMIESERATRAITRTQAGVQYCQNALNEAVRTIRSAAAPGNFAGVSQAALLQPRYRKNEISLLTCDSEAPGGFSRVTLGRQTRGDEVVGLQRACLPLSDSPTRAAQARVTALGGLKPERFEPSIDFGYAAMPNPGQKIDYLDEWTSTTPPALVQVTVRVRLNNGPARHDDITLQTAVIPGLLPASAAAAPAITAPPVPLRTAASPAQPQRPAQATPTATPTPSATPAATAAPTTAPTAKPIKELPATPPIRVLDRQKLDRLKGGTPKP